MKKSAAISQARGSDFYEHAPLGLMTVDREGIILDANPPAAAMLKEVRDSLPGQPLRGFILGEDEAVFNGLLRKLFETGEPQACELRLRRPNGPPSWARLDATRTGALRSVPLGYIALSDITSRRKAEEALQKSERQFKMLFMSMEEGFYLSEVIRDEQGLPCDYRYLEVNPTFEKIIGLERGRIVGKRYKEIVPEDTTRWLEAYGKVAITGEPVTFYFYSPEYRKHFETYSYRPAPGQVSVIVRDVTERKRAEAEIARALQEKEILLREVYHRTKNNLNIVSALLSLRASAEGMAALTRIVDDINLRIRTMAMVHQRLYESRDLSLIDLGEFLRDVVSLGLKIGASPAGRVEAEFDLQIIPAPIDVIMPLGLLVTELVSNSLKHGFAGRAKGRIRMELSRSPENEIELTLADDGIGVPSGFRFDTGSTLGLKILYMLVEHQLGGSLRFESRGGVTCRARVPLPGAAAKGLP